MRYLDLTALQVVAICEQIHDKNTPFYSCRGCPLKKESAAACILCSSPKYWLKEPHLWNDCTRLAIPLKEAGKTIGELSIELLYEAIAIGAVEWQTSGPLQWKVLSHMPGPTFRYLHPNIYSDFS